MREVRHVACFRREDFYVRTLARKPEEKETVWKTSAYSYMMLKWTLKQHGKVWNGVLWFDVRTNGGLMKTQK
jgi:hypothetical protein